MSTQQPPAEPPIYEQDPTFWTRYNEWKEQLLTLSNHTYETYQSQPIWRKVLIIILAIVFGIAGICFLIYHEALLHFIADYSERWEHNPWTGYILIVILFIISFPPMIGFSLTGTTVGAVYGVSFKGWFIIAIGSIIGSVASFVLFRYTLKSKAHALIKSNRQLRAFSSILNDHGSYWLLALIRLCPFPYSLTNGALAGIPGVTVLNFTLGSIISSPKLVLYLFVGDKIKDMGKTKDPATKVFDFISISLASIFLTLTGWILFTKINKRVQELEAEARVAAGQPIQTEENSYDANDDDSLRLGDDDLNEDLELGAEDNIELEESNLINSPPKYKD